MKKSTIYTTILVVLAILLIPMIGINHMIYNSIPLSDFLVSYVIPTGIITILIITLPFVYKLLQHIFTTIVTSVTNNKPFFRKTLIRIGIIKLIALSIISLSVIIHILLYYIIPHTQLLRVITYTLIVYTVLLCSLLFPIYFKNDNKMLTSNTTEQKK